MTTANRELFELCKQVYEVTGWGADMDKGVDYVWCHETLTRLPIDWDTSDFHQHIPLYTSDYLLEKLPRRLDIIQLDETRGWLASWAYPGLQTAQLRLNPQGIGTTPLKALLKLTLKLHEEKQL